MRLLLSVALFAPLAFGQDQVSLEVLGVTSTQALLHIRGASSPCTIDLRQGSADGPLHPDLTASVDISRPDTLIWPDGTRIVTLGHQRSNLALFAEITWFGTVSGCASSVIPFSFTTQTPALGANWLGRVPFNPDRWNNADYPVFDWSPEGRDKTYADPVSGLQMKIVNASGDFSWRYGPFALATWSGGEGWNNPGQAIAGSASNVASTSNTNPLDVYFPLDGPLQFPWADYRGIDNFGLVVYGSGTEGGGGAADREVEICLVFNPSQGCAGTPFRITLPTGTPTKVAGSSADNDGAWPKSFPNALFAGWGGAIVTRDRLAQKGIVSTAASGLLTIANPDKYTHFPVQLNPGNFVQVTGSGCVPNDLCAVTDITHAGVISVASNISGSNIAYTAFPWSIRVRKVTGSGSISVGFQLKVSGTLMSATIPEGFQCHPVEVTSSDGIRGHACAIPGPTMSYRYLYFLANDGSVRRPISAFAIPRSQFGSWPSQDRPSGGYTMAPAPFGFSLTDGGVFYSAMPSASGKWSVYRLTYKGDWKTEINHPYDGGWGGDLPVSNENFQWENLMPGSQGKDLSSQVASAFPNYDKTLYGSWDSPSFGGISGSKAFFYRIPGGQDGGPCWIATVDLNSGSVISLINTLDGTGAPEMAWGNCHSISAPTWPPNTLAVSLNVLAVGNTSKLLAGPFDVKPNAVMRGGTWSSDTGLPWPVDNSYDNACPTDLSGDQKNFGAVDDQCVTLKLPGHPCNLNPSAAERAAFPQCSWNPAFTQPYELHPGNHFADFGLPTPGDSEPFRVLRVTPLPGNELMVVAQRNASWDYCCIQAGRPGASCANTPARLQHVNSWSMRMYPGTKNSCTNSLFMVDFSSGVPKPQELPRTLGGGHYAVGKNHDNIDYVSGNLVKRNVPLGALAEYPATGTKISFPAFAGVSAGIGSIVQQYLSRSQTSTETDTDLEWALDGNAYNPSYGAGGGNVLYNSIGSRSITRVSGNVWKIGLVGSFDYKRQPLLGWAGNRILKDISGPGSNIMNASDYSFCHVLRSGECGTGSAGETFVKVPRVYPIAACLTAMVWANVPCVVPAHPGVGGIRQVGIASPDLAGNNSRFLTYGFAAPGIHNPFFGPGAHPGGKSMLVPSGQYLDGVRMVAMIFRLPEWRNDSLMRNSFGGLNVQVPARNGATHARIKFGYNTDLQCSNRAEACVTDSQANPFAFENDSPLSPVTCSNGCEIPVPVVSGKIVYYQAEWLAGGQIVETGLKTALAVP